MPDGAPAWAIAKPGPVPWPHDPGVGWLAPVCVIRRHALFPPASRSALPPPALSRGVRVRLAAAGRGGSSGFDPELQPLLLRDIARVAHDHPNAYATQTVAITRAALDDAERFTRLLDRLVHDTRFTTVVLAGLPIAARHAQGDIRSIFSCCDYHVTDDGLRLIEVNTHASGAIVSALWQAELTRRGAVQRPVFPNVATVMARFLDALEADWAAFDHRGGRALRTIAIVDDDPPSQAYFQEFLLAKTLLEQRGYRVSIMDARTARNLDGIDLVYNRCCDFYFETPEHAWLLDALLRNAAVFTPSPRIHALIGRKDVLVYLSEIADGCWPQLGLNAEDLAFLLRIVPRAQFLVNIDPEAFWDDRKQWVLKPRDRFQGKGVYRGQSLSHATYKKLLREDYVVQTQIPPSRTPDGLKSDVRFYHYSKVQFGVARLYEGQITNFQSPRGGNAPLVWARRSRQLFSGHRR
ncbi:MAG: hypothetical protein HY543_12985 [Deltaproteobacteria bacterium]|nr:hypothetical protein [Deltaproteobacteria bacterium]